MYGVTNSDLDTACSNARDVATSIINAKLGLKADLSTVPDTVTRCCSLLASGIIATGPDDDLEKNAYYKAGMALLDNLGEENIEGEIYNIITVDGFGRYDDAEHDPTIPQL